jgi:hypothetical protein
VLLRSQTLLSSGRAINFFPKNPSRTAKELPLDVQISLVVVFSCLLMPMVLLLNPFGFLRSFASLATRYLVRACQRMRIFGQQGSDREWPSSQEPDETLRAPVGLESARGDDSDVAASSAISLSAEFGVSHSRPNSDPNKHLSKLFSEEPVQSAFRMHSSNPSSHLRPVLPTLDGDLSLASAVDRLRLRKLAQRGATCNKDTLVSPAQISLRECVDGVKILTLPKNMSNE